MCREREKGRVLVVEEQSDEFVFMAKGRGGGVGVGGVGAHCNIIKLD